MIAPMKHFTLLCVAEQGERTLEKLRDLGCAHLDFSGAASAGLAEAKESLSDAEQAVRILARAAKELPGAEDSAKRFGSVRNGDFVRAVLAADEERAGLAERLAGVEKEIREYAPFGDYDPGLAEKLGGAGFGVRLAKARAGTEAGAAAGGVAQRLGGDGRTDWWVFVNMDLPEGFEAVAAPRARLAEMEAEAEGLRAKLAEIGAALSAANLRAGVIADAFPGLKDRVEFEAARDVLEKQGAVAWIEGWIPEDSVPRLRAQAVTSAWGIMLRDARDGENPPTLIRPPKLFRPVAALFEGLGIAPAYNETDVSVPFMCYFSLFFAMLVGDGGYGAIILALTLLGWRKTRPAEGHRPRAVRSWLTLLTVFSAATVAWGALSNTWFGAGFEFAKDWPTVKWLGDETYGNMMFLCFTIGASHLMVARIWSGLCMLNDRACLAQFGWAGIVLFMYMVTNTIVGIFTGGIPQWAYWTFGASLFLVFGFTLKGHELKTRGIELGMLPLNVMSALGDIISYVRLFAVGLASVKVAQNFNDMALGLDMPLWLKIVPMVLILLIGHAINFVMAGLSILVHAVRLNTLEFSNHKGISWAGHAFAPFKKH